MISRYNIMYAINVLIKAVKEIVDAQLIMRLDAKYQNKST